MRDYDELVKALRETRETVRENPGLAMRVPPYQLSAAADAIEELVSNADKFKWIKIESRPMTEEERKEWSERIGYDIEYEEAIIYVSPLPDDGQEVLVCDKWGHVWIDTFLNDPDYGWGFEIGDMDYIVAWMPRPEPYEPPKEDDNA